MIDRRDDPDLDLDDARRAVLLRHARAIAAGGDPDEPLTAAHAFPPPPDMTPGEGLGLLAAMALVMLSGLASGWLSGLVGVRAASLLLLAIASGAAWGLGGATLREHGRLPASVRFGLIGVLLVATLVGSPLALALVPALVHAAIARMMFASRRDEMSLIEKGARLSHPLAPAFIRPYCQRLTVVWAGLFAMSALVTACFAIGGYAEAHRAWTEWQFWTLLGAFSAVEFLWRKAWFRYFGRGPLDRLLARLFPPEATERGRRSQAYLLRMRTELARLAEIERQNAKG
jgi:uncharacterized membrane protein